MGGEEQRADLSSMLIQQLIQQVFHSGPIFLKEECLAFKGKAGLKGRAEFNFDFRAHGKETPPKINSTFPC